MYAPLVPWLLIKISAALPDVGAVSEALEACEALSVTIEAQSDEERFQSALEATSLWNANQVIGLFPQQTDVLAVLAAVRVAVGKTNLAHEVALLPDADWERAWMTQYRPIEITPRLWICPSWCTPPDPQAINLLLDPGLAFGTGTHPTTALCLQWLAEQDCRGKTVIDYGCGSGILAVAALKLGAAHALAIDVDPQALTVARENAARNGVAAALRAVAPEDLSDRDNADLVLANILAEPLIALAAEIQRRVKPTGALALSGLLTTQADDVARHYTPFEFTRRERDGWSLLTGARIY